MMKKKNEQANSKKKYKCEIVYQQKCAMYTDVTFWTCSLVYLGLRVVSNDMTHIKAERYIVV
jgi:hypothetical protein